MGSLLAIKSGTTSVQGATVKGDFRYFSASTLDLGPTSITGLYSGIDAPLGGYTVYQTGGPNNLNARVASNNTELNTILITAGATGTTLSNRITWASNTNSVFINSGTTTTYYFGGQFNLVDYITALRAISLNTDASQNTSFNIGTAFNNAVISSTIQSDGKILVGGQFTTYQDATQNYLIRLNSDGSKDTSFDIGNGFSGSGVIIYSITIQSDGKILVGGQFTTYQGSSQNNLIRLNSDGSKDTSFNIGTGFGGQLRTTSVQSDGKILVGGSFTTFTGSSQNNLIRLNSDGSKDTSFNIGTGFNTLVDSIAIQSDGKILVGGSFTTFTGSSQNCLIRLNSDGSKDTSFNIGTGFLPSANSVDTLVIQSDGKILVGGSFTTFTGATQNRLIRLNSDGSKDTSFDIGTGFTSAVFSLVIQSDGKILAGGQFDSYQGVTQNRLIRLNSDGSKDTSFNIGDGFNTTVFSITINSFGNIFLGGQFTQYQKDAVTQNRIVRTLNYSRDASFDIGTGFNNTVRSIVIQSGGKTLVGGLFTTYQGATENRLIRLNTDGSKDTSFDIGTGFDNFVYSTTIQSDEKILVGGAFTTFSGVTQNKLIRLNSYGSKDTSFDIGTGFGGAEVRSVVIQSDEKILVGGGFVSFTGTTQLRLIRLNSDGSKDTSFDIGTGFNDFVYSIAIQSDGKILVGGGFSTFTGTTQNRLIRLNSDGSKDSSFDIGTGFNNTFVLAVSIQSDGKILVGGNFTTYKGLTQNFLIRLNTDGSKDTSFDIGTGFDNIVRTISIQSDGKILVGGDFTFYQKIISRRTVLLNSDGSFNNTGVPTNNFVFTSAIQQ